MLLEKNSLKKIIISQDSTILKAINNLNASGVKIVLIVDKNNKFMGILNFLFLIFHLHQHHKWGQKTLLNSIISVMGII